MELPTMNLVALMMVGCVLLAGQADAWTKIFSREMVGNRTVFVPNHESLVLKCETRNFLHYPVTGAVSGEYRHKLFVKKGGEEIPVATSVVDGCETLVNHTVTKTSSTSVTVEVLFTLFRVKAEQAGSFTYGCMLVAEDAPNVNLLTQSSSSNNLNIVVCPEPLFSLSIEEGNSQSEIAYPNEGKHVVLNTKDECHFDYAVSYLVNGVSSSDIPSHQAVKRDDSSLEIHSPVCVGHRVCNVTAVFKYIYERNDETSQSHMSLNNCCIDVGPTPTPPKATGGNFLKQKQRPTESSVLIGLVVILAIYGVVVTGVAGVYWKRRDRYSTPPDQELREQV
ncbi:uncharacterized protein LOC117291262 isoform X2 [Asterias rubens]|uniref:uncharacterized protein LOC117291262 isoform X2 n=1 Tax=Asterias rubens TaxID=7604 RepID=UPI001455283B|nr:uncharacterized protein LOC117291262 isoform X2 [Asterias rubens]